MEPTPRICAQPSLKRASIVRRQVPVFGENSFLVMTGSFRWAEGQIDHLTALATHLVIR
jgi:hypothetical protein